MSLLGWSNGKGPLGDDTHVWHAVVTDGGIGTRTACGAHVMLSGQVEPKPQRGGTCRRCLKSKIVKDAKINSKGSTLSAEIIKHACDVSIKQFGKVSS